MAQNKAQLRATLLKKRQQLTDLQLSSAALDIVKVVQENNSLNEYFAQAETILSYAAFKGEVNPESLIKDLSATTYLPKIINFTNAVMAFYPATQAQVKNRYGIYEPRGDGKPTEINNFDIALVPLVGFDHRGNRIGMGAGFYDRVFADLTECSRRPLLIGLAHSCQETNSIQPDSWDKPLDVILTEERIIDLAGVLSN